MEAKKHLRLHQKTVEIIKEKDSACYSIPNNKQVNKIRNPVEYYRDQLKFEENKRLKIEYLNKLKIEKEGLEVRAKPQINKVS